MLRVADAQRALPQYEVGKAQLLLRTQLPCLGCHELDGDGGTIAPSLSTVGGRRSAAYIRAIIEDPQKTLPGAAMLAKAAELDPGEPLAWFNLGNVALLGGAFAAAAVNSVPRSSLTAALSRCTSSWRASTCRRETIDRRWRNCVAGSPSTRRIPRRGTLPDSLVGPFGGKAGYGQSVQTVDRSPVGRVSKVVTNLWNPRL